MWQIRNPLKVYSSIFEYAEGGPFTLFALITKEKFESIPKEHIAELKQCRGVTITQVKIKDPNNLAERIDAITIQYRQTK
jgi:hypothetical protein